MSWQDNPDYTEPADGESRQIMGVTGGDRVRAGDTYTLTFEDNGEEIETQNGDRVAFDAVLESASFVPVDGDHNEIEAGDEVRFMTGSARFLSELSDHAPVDGSTLTVEVAGTGFDSAYSITPDTSE